MDNLIFSGEKVRNIPLLVKKLSILIGTIMVIGIITSGIFIYKTAYKKGLAMGETNRNFYEEVVLTKFVDDQFEATEKNNPLDYSYWLFKTSIPKDILDDVVAISITKGLDPNFTLSILYQENPKYNPSAKGARNGDGTRDYGLWQINEKNLRNKSFMKSYWGFDEPFEWYNPEHSTIVAISFLADIYNMVDFDYNKTAMGYNGGPGKAKYGNSPERAVSYAKNVMENYDLAKYQIALAMN